MRSLLALGILFSLLENLTAQQINIPGRPTFTPYIPTEYDVSRAQNIPVLTLPEAYRFRILPQIVDNSLLNYFLPNENQFPYADCQQVSAISYDFAYEINRLKNQSSLLAENQYPARYTWSLLNNGANVGISYFSSFDVVKAQGHMNTTGFGTDTVNGTTRWVSGYENYLQGMSNRLKAIHAIPVNTEEGILTLRNYLYDHLDGSSAGGVAVFSCTLPNWFILNNTLPENTPEAGKYVTITFTGEATHGMTIVGYNDSIRYDLNGDGKYANNLDITGDGVVDVRDREIGGFKYANTFGAWWGNQGCCYVLYSAMAKVYGNGGIWNGCVYVLEPALNYQPLQTVKVNLDYNDRDNLRFVAGINPDTTQEFPTQTMEFPIFNFQGGNHPMQGTPDSVNEGFEFGLDISPLLSYVEPQIPYRLFLMIYERDSAKAGHGRVHKVSFLNHFYGIKETVANPQEWEFRDNQYNIFSAISKDIFLKVKMIREQLPSYTPGKPYSVQLHAEGGYPAYRWQLRKNYKKQLIQSTFPLISEHQAVPVSAAIPYAKIALPFSFPFYGKNYDTVYMNVKGMAVFTPVFLPFPFVTDPILMLKAEPLISPSFGIDYTINASLGDGMWYETTPEHAIFRWKLSGTPYLNPSMQNEFAICLHPDGTFEMFFGQQGIPSVNLLTCTGISGGDEINFEFSPNTDPSAFDQKSYRYSPLVLPAAFSLSPDGLLGVSQADSSVIYDIPVMVTDQRNISDFGTFSLSNRLTIEPEIISAENGALVFGQDCRMNLHVGNTGQTPIENLQLRLRVHDSLIAISDSIAFIELLPSGGAAALSDAFLFHLNQWLPDQYRVTLEIEATDGFSRWTKMVDFTVASPEFVCNAPLIKDGSDGFLNPGEVAAMIIEIRNTGSLDATMNAFSLSSSDGKIEFLSQRDTVMDNIPARSTTSLWYLIRANRSATTGELAGINLHLSNAQGFEMDFPFTLNLGKIPVALFALDGDTLSRDAMASALDSLNLNYAFWDVLTADLYLEKYSSVFVLKKQLGSAPGILSPERQRLANYLDQGGNLYFEAFSYFLYNYRNTELFSYFHYIPEKVSAFSILMVEGYPATFTDSMEYTYTCSQNVSLIRLLPADSAFSLFMVKEDTSRALQIAYDGDSYKTIASLLEFGSLLGADEPSSSTTLMKRYLDFFGLNLTGPYPYFHAIRTEIARGESISFTDDSFDNIISRQWEFPGGNPSSSTEQNPLVIYDQPGSYDVVLTVNDGQHSKSLRKKEYILVRYPMGIDGSESGKEIRIFPNPAGETVTIGLPDRLRDEKIDITLTDFTGRPLWTKTFPGNSPQIRIQPGCLKLGLYFIRISGRTFSTVKKLMIR